MASRLRILGFCVWLSLSALAFGAGSDSPYIVDTDNLGRTFDGIGGVSGGATSPLLVNYPEKQRNEILDYLFKPNFAASLQILKVEVGGDAQSTDGTELSHMHYPWDENYQRGYEWWLMVEAKKRNPNIKLYGLPYAYPGWLGKDGLNPSTYPDKTADYIARWINGAKTHYNLTIDYIGLWNERNMTTEYVKTLRSTLDNRGFNSTMIVAPDIGPSKTTVVSDIKNDPEYAAAVSRIGYHFPGTIAPDDAILLGKPLWASSDYSTFNDEVGGGCWARLVNRNYAIGHMTATISWNVVASYYNPLPFFRQGLMTAIEPWSGHYVVAPPIWISAHTAQFTETGWTYLAHGSGVGMLAGGGSYVTLISPDGKDLTIVIETMSHDHSICIRPPLPKFSVVPQNITLQFSGRLGNELSRLNVWYSKLGFDGETTKLFEKLKPLQIEYGATWLSLGVDEIYTLTTLERGQKGEYPLPPPSKPFPPLYSDDFEGIPVGQEPPNFLQQTGAFEVVISDDADRNKVVRQMVLDMPVAWCSAENVAKAVTLIGDSDWSNVYTEVDAAVGKVNGTDGVFLAARMQNAGCETPDAVGVFFFLYPNTQQYAVYYDIVAKKLLTKGQLSFALSSDWNRLSLLVEGTWVLGGVNGKPVFNVTAPDIVDSGFVAFGTSSYGIADFDNFIISASGTGQGKHSLYK